MNDHADYLGLVADGRFVALEPPLASERAVRFTRAGMQALYPPEQEEFDLSEYEGRAIVIRGHRSGDWVWSAHVIDKAPPILTEAVLTVFGGGEQPADEANAGSPLGTNLTEITEFGREWSFVDVFKTSLPWVSGPPWDDGRRLDLDKGGWILSLQADQVASTLLLKDLGSRRPAGRYLVLYDGKGRLAYRDAARLDPSASREGRHVIDVDSPGEQIRIDITEVDSTDPLRNIRVLMPGGVCAEDPFRWCLDHTGCDGDCIPFEDGPSTAFHPVFLSRIRNYKVLRFMDWMRTNKSVQLAWRDRPMVGDARWTQRYVPVEVMAALSNRIHADPWFCMSHLACDEDVAEFARLVLSRLDPRRKVYVEHSNEVWNGIFPQAHVAAMRGLAMNLSNNERQAQLRYHSKRSQEIFKIWQDVFGSQRQRIVRVVGTQAADTWVSREVLGYANAGRQTDALAIAPYFGGELGRPENETRVKQMSLDELFDDLESHALPQTIEWIRSQAQVAREYGVDLIAYEGGQHLAGVGGVENDEAINDLFDRANRDPRMGSLYGRLLDAWRQEGGKLFVHYSNCNAYGRSGRWGSLEYLDQPLEEAPKFNALQRFIEENPIWWEEL